MNKLLIPLLTICFSLLVHSTAQAKKSAPEFFGLMRGSFTDYRSGFKIRQVYQSSYSGATGNNSVIYQRLGVISNQGITSLKNEAKEQCSQNDFYAIDHFEITFTSFNTSANLMYLVSANILCIDN
jgi:hypothetical protein